ncbi:MAG TPA: TRAM domain-containing protein [Thermoanaerobaculaceae bacterium]|nr:TRAM domain-containing protein [Thermoanaerobaculaceae bacterium]
MRLEITGIAGGGRGFARAGGRAWFVAGALPGEVVEAAVERERAGVVEARAVAVERPSAWREATPCPVAEACGGCDLAHVRRDAAAAILREVTCGALRHADPALAAAARAAEVVVSPMPWRLRARLHWDPVRRALGFFGPRSRRTVEITPCRVVSRRLLDAMPAMAAALASGGAAAGDLDWLESLDGGTAVAGWRGARCELPRVDGLDGWHPVGRDGGIGGGGWGETGVTMPLRVPLRVPVGAFFQGNRHLVPPLFDRIAELVRVSGAQRVVDLYAGVGFLAAAAATAGAAELALVESSGVAASAAAANLPAASVACATAERYLAGPRPGRDALAIVDPPRTGMSAAVLAALLDWCPIGVVMLGCDAARFGRDAGRLLAHGYRLESMQLWDMFAGSHHVEILASFARAAG